LVKVKAHKETFDCWETEDIAQEIRIICVKALPKFNADRASDVKGVVNYFGTCVDNRLRNVKRDNYIRFTPPFPKETIRQVKENPEQNPELYNKLVKFDQKLVSQKKIKHPVTFKIMGGHRPSKQ